MEKFLIFILLMISLQAPLSASEADEKRDAYFKAKSDTILQNYDETEFKKAVLKILQKSNATNMDLFMLELEEIRRGGAIKEEKLTGLDNINREYRKGMDGWMVTISGILVVYVGLAIIATVVIMFNFMLKERPSRKKKHVKQAVKPAMIQQTPKLPAEPIPEDHLVAIATAVELYYRLYVQSSISGLTFSNSESASWKSGNKFGTRKIQRI
jgi:hypothetical protein